MVVMGRHRGNGKALAEYLISTASNDNVAVLDIRGTANEKDLRSSLIEMSLTSELTRSKKGLYHLQLNPAYGEDKRMTVEDWLKAAEILEKQTGFENQKRAIVLHEKNGRIHAHVVFERFSHKDRKMISDSYSRLAQDRARKEIEIALGHRRTPHRNDKRPQLKEILSKLWGECDTPTEFIKKAREQGYHIVNSQSRRPYMIVDSEGRSFDLVRQLKVRTRQVREKFQGLNLEKDKVVIRRIRDKISSNNIDDTQEYSLDKILQQKAKYDARQEELLLFKEKFGMMHSNAVQITTNKQDDQITKSQSKLERLRLNHKKRQFDENAEAVIQEKKQETSLEKALRELQEAIQKEEERAKRQQWNLTR